ncbi:MAG: hypothetical protein HY559_02185 [Gammaproteobacteria bacterium]|nr:hypothetical protein [Gammaproteobacteria bacterium]
MEFERRIDLTDYFLAQGRKTFSLQEVATLTSDSEATIQRKIHRLIQDNRVKKIAQSYYAILSPRERKSGHLTPHDYIDQLMKYEKIPYYVGLLSAASLYGAAHHRPMVYQVITEKQVHISKTLLSDIHFFRKIHFPEFCLEQKKGEYGSICFSSPALTAYDLVRYESSCGTIYNVISVISELKSVIKEADLVQLLKNKVESVIIQRLGFALEQVGFEKIPITFKEITSQAINYAPLSKYESLDKSHKNKEWKIIDNLNWDELDDI